MTCQYPEYSGDKKYGEEELGLIWRWLRTFEIVPIGSGSFVIIFINTVLFFVFSLIDERE